MGGPASPSLSNLYMEFFEKHELSKILPPGVPWFRYVDDVLCLWPRDRPLEPFIEQLNSLVHSIKFTVEEGQNSSISLDIKIHRHNNSFKFSVYRKPNNNKLFILLTLLFQSCF